MARLALLAILVVWMSWSKGLGSGDSTPVRPAMDLAVFLGGYAVILFGLRGWAALATRRAMEGHHGSLRRFQFAMDMARLLIPAWLGVGIYVFHWGLIVQSAVPALYRWPSVGMHLELVPAVLGTLPAMIAWVGLWWAHFPTDRSIREQNVLVNLNDDLPVHAPPTFWATLGANFRLQIAFTLFPVLCILAFRDLTVAGFCLAGIRDAHGYQDTVMLPVTFLVFIMAPELLRRVLRTETLADSPLRRRLEAMCRQAGLGYRDILLWRTDSAMGNAAVMGLFPRVRYVLLSDLLLETMTDQQIEAVFAHELGHVVHKHLWWFCVFIMIALAFMSGPGNDAMFHLRHWYIDTRGHSTAAWDTIEGLVGSLLFFGFFILAFGYLSPRFERQADVYAARTLEGGEATERRSDGATKGEEGSTVCPSSPSRSHVGEYGAAVFAAALHRVAMINHIPVAARNWSHGSIAHRMRAVREMSAHPAHTRRFDRRMTRLYVGLIACLCIFGTWAAVQVSREAKTNLRPQRTGVIIPSQAVGAGR